MLKCERLIVGGRVTGADKKKAVAGHRKIDFEVAERIRADHQSGLSYTDILIKYNPEYGISSKGNVSAIVNRKIWNNPEGVKISEAPTAERTSGPIPGFSNNKGGRPKQPFIWHGHEFPSSPEGYPSIEVQKASTKTNVKDRAWGINELLKAGFFREGVGSLDRVAPKLRAELAKHIKDQAILKIILKVFWGEEGFLAALATNPEVGTDLQKEILHKIPRKQSYFHHSSIIGALLHRPSLTPEIAHLILDKAELDLEKNDYRSVSYRLLSNFLEHPTCVGSISIRTMGLIAAIKNHGTPVAYPDDKDFVLDRLKGTNVNDPNFLGIALSVHSDFQAEALLHYFRSRQYKMPEEEQKMAEKIVHFDENSLRRFCGGLAFSIERRDVAWTILPAIIKNPSFNSDYWMTIIHKKNTWWLDDLLGCTPLPPRMLVELEKIGALDSLRFFKHRSYPADQLRERLEELALESRPNITLMAGVIKKGVCPLDIAKVFIRRIAAADGNRAKYTLQDLLDSDSVSEVLKDEAREVLPNRFLDDET